MATGGGGKGRMYMPLQKRSSYLQSEWASSLDEDTYDG